MTKKLIKLFFLSIFFIKTLISSENLEKNEINRKRALSPYIEKKLPIIKEETESSKNSEHKESKKKIKSCCGLCCLI